MSENNFLQGDVFTDKYSGKNFEVMGPKCPLGEGGFGEVYLVKDLSTDENFVAKVPNFKKHAGDPKAIDTVKKKQRQEAEIIRDLTLKNVPSVVRFVDTFEIENKGDTLEILLIEKAKGVTLKDWVGNNGAMAERHVKIVLEKLAIAMRGIHKATYIHRDIKDENIFIDGPLDDPQLTIIDFGISAVFDNSKTHAIATNLMHSHFYAPPEQKTLNEARPSTDVFAIGAIAFFLLTGGNRNPGRDSRYKPQDFGVDVSDDFNLLIEKATWDNPVHRYMVMDELILAIRGKPMTNQMPRIVSVGDVHVLEEDEIWICRKTNHIKKDNIIQIDERTDPLERTWFISRKHAVVQKDHLGIYRIFDAGFARSNGRTQSLNGTVWRANSTNEWRYLPEQGLPLMSSYIEIGIGFTKQAPDAKDKNGDPILPGPYKVIQYAPPEIPTT